MSQESFITRCSQCGTKNRIPKGRMGDKSICGKCGSPLSAEIGFNHPMDINDRTFDKEVLSFGGAALVDCWAPWCGPCRMVAPVLEEMAVEYGKRVKIAKLNVDENPGISSRYSIKSIPTMLLFNGGRHMDTLVGALPREEIEKRLNKLLSISS